MAAGHPIITQVGFQHAGGQIMYPVQQGGQTPQGMGPPVIPQPQPYQPYQQPLPYTKQVGFSLGSWLENLVKLYPPPLELAR